MRLLARVGGWVFAFASLFYLLSVPVQMIVFKAELDAALGQTRSWGEILRALADAGLLPLFLVGIIAQVSFATGAGSCASFVLDDRLRAVIPAIAMGTFAIAFSLTIFGGLLGAFAGILTIGAGALVWPSLLRKPGTEATGADSMTQGPATPPSTP